MTHTNPPGLGLVIDCADPVTLAEFWGPALDYETVGAAGSYVALVPNGRPGPKLLLPRVEEEKVSETSVGPSEVSQILGSRCEDDARAPLPQRNASSCPTDDHHFVAFGVGEPPAILRLVKEPATGCDGRGEARLREVRRHRELEVDAVALPAPLRLQSIELLEHQHRVQPPRIVDVDDPGSRVVRVSECGDPEPRTAATSVASRKS